MSLLGDIELKSWGQEKGENNNNNNNNINNNNS